MSIEHENLDTIAQGQDESGLEQYGVWVKRSPEEELAEEVRDDKIDSDSSDIFLDDIDFDDLPPADISSLEIAEPVIDSDLNDKIEETLDAEAQSKQDDLADMLPETADLEKFAADLEDFQPPETKPADKKTVPSVEEAVSDKDIETLSDTSTVDIDLNEYMADSEDPEDSLLDEKPLDIDLSFQDNFENITPDFPKEESSSSTFEAEDVSDMFSDDAPPPVITEEVAIENFDQGASPSHKKDEIPDVTEIPEMAELGEMEEFAESTSSYDFPVDFTAHSKNTVPGEDKTPQDMQMEKSSSGGSFMESIDINEFNTDIFPADASSTQNSKAAGSDTVYDISVRADDDSDSEEENTSVSAAENPSIQTMSTALFDKIMDELSLLRRDITDLKTDLGALKHRDTEYIDTAEEELPHTNGSGFFSDDEEDETIALSGDELNNILTSADFTAADPEPVEEIVYDEEVENQTENPAMPVLNLQETELTEPALDDISFDIAEEEAGETLPNEIAIPVSDDLIVDSANDDFFAEDDTPKDIDDTAVHFLCEDPKKCDPFTDEMSAADTVEAADENIGDMTTVEEESEDIFEDTDIAAAAEDIFSVDEVAEAEEFTEPEELIEPAEPEAVPEETEDAENISAETAEITEEETEREIPSAFDMNFEEELEQEDLSQFSPVDEVFNSKQWVSEEEAAAEQAEAAAEQAAAEGAAEDVIIEAEMPEYSVNSYAEEVSETDSAQIPQNMREEIKSVLAYMDRLLENLPEEKIVEFARSEHFPVYKKLFTELGLS